MKSVRKPKKQEKLGAFAYTSVFFSMMLALFVIGILGVIFSYTYNLTDEIRNNAQVQIFLSDNLHEADRMHLNTVISTKKYVAVKDQIPQIEFVPKDKAAREFIKTLGEDFISFLGENPIKDSFTIAIKTKYHNKDSLNVIKKDLLKLKGVHDINYVEDLMASINKNLQRLTIAALIFFIIMVVIIVLLINNTIRLALFSQRFLIKSMQLAGADKSFIIKPFRNRSIMYGLIAGVLSSSIIWLLVQYTQQEIPEIQTIHKDSEIALVLVGVIFIGIIISSLCTTSAAKKYLGIPLDELY